MPCGLSLVPQKSDSPKREARDLNGEPGDGGFVLDEVAMVEEGDLSSF